MSAAARLYFDLGSPYAWLTAERIDAVMPGPVAWCPVLLGGLFRATGRGSWAQTERRAEGMREIEERAAAYGLPPVAWPEPWPNDGLLAMRCAVAADAQGSGRAFALAALRVHFAEGRALSDAANVALAAERSGHDEEALLAAAAEPATKQRLRALTDAALHAGVTGVPTVALASGALFWGDDRLGEAAEAAAR